VSDGDELDAQRAYFASDEHVKARAAVWSDASPEECLAAVIEQCRAADYLLDLKSPEDLVRVLERPPLPADTIALLEHLARSTS
jgi:hypothetical protein